MKVGNKVRCIGTRTQRSYRDIEGVITDIIQTSNEHSKHVRLELTKAPARCGYQVGQHTFIYCSDLQIIPDKLNPNTRVI